MALIYITGIPGAGKSTIRQELLCRGYEAYGGAEDGIAAFYNNKTGAKISGWVEATDRTPEWSAQHAWKINRLAVKELKDRAKNKAVFLCAVRRNDVDELWDLFDKVIALVIDKETLQQRLATRTNNDVGKTPTELTNILERQRTSQEKYEKLGAIIIDATQPVEQVVDKVINLSQES